MWLQQPLVTGFCEDMTQITAWCEKSLGLKNFWLACSFMYAFHANKQLNVAVTYSLPIAGVLGEIILTLWLQKITKKSQ